MKDNKQFIKFAIGVVIFLVIIFTIYDTVKDTTLTLVGTLGIAIVLLKLKADNDLKKSKKFSHGTEHGSAKWGNKKEAEVLKAKKEDNNILLTETESLLINERPAEIKNDRNKNVLVIGGSGSGKTRFFIKPNIMQLHSSYIVTDPKGTIMIEQGEMLKRNGYDLKVFNTVNLEKSFHYNPFRYIKTEFDILSLTNTLIDNTKGDGEKSGEDFWVKAERLLYMALISIIHYHPLIKNKNIPTLLDIINTFHIDEDNPDAKDGVDFFFDEYEKQYKRDNFLDEEYNKKTKENLKRTLEKIKKDITDEDVEKHFEKYKEDYIKNKRIYINDYPLRQYVKYKMAAGKTAKSILISCAARLAVFEIKELRDIMFDDNLELDKIGGYIVEKNNKEENEIIKLKTALFLIISDTDTTLNFILAIMFSQLFNFLCKKADDKFNGKLPVHIRFLIDEFANIGTIPNFDKLIATIRSREISASIVLQSKSQLKSIYKDNADTIIGNCDSMLFLGGKEESTLKDLSEMLGKTTIDIITTGQSYSQTNSSSVNFQKSGKELMAINELTTMDGGKCILQIRGFNSWFSNKYNILKHKRVNQTLDGTKNIKPFDILKHCKEYKKIEGIENIESIKNIKDEKIIKEELIKEPRLRYFVSEDIQNKIEKSGGLVEYLESKGV